MKGARLAWTIVFLGVTFLAIAMELVAGLWHPAGWTIPWTEYLARYVPWPIQLVAYVALATWLPFHFWRHDHLRQVAYRRGIVEGTAIGLNRALAQPVCNHCAHLAPAHAAGGCLYRLCLCTSGDGL